MTARQKAVVIAQINAAFQAHAPAGSTVTLHPVKGIGKLYELRVLAFIMNLLRSQRLRIRIANGNRIHFRQSPGSIDRTRSWLEVLNSSRQVVGEIMLDIEFQTISFERRRRQAIPPPSLTQGDRHELDIGLFEPGLPTQARPNYDHVILAAECKHTAMNKGFIRNMLGLRRELSMLQGPRSMTNPLLPTWPRSAYSNDPPSALLLICNDRKVLNYRSITHTFDISLCYLPM